MVSFRKSFLLLALFVAITAVASAQTTPLVCTAQAGNVPLARAEGLAEETGQIQIICTGGSPTKAGQVINTSNVQIFLNVNITSKVLGDPWTEALLLIDEPQPAGTAGATNIQLVCGDGSTYVDPNSLTCPVTAATNIGLGNYTGGGGMTLPSPYPAGSYSRPNIWQARCTSGTCATSPTNTLAWLGVPLDPPGTGPSRVVRLVNVRANSNGVPVSGTLVPSTITALISISGTGGFSLVQPNITVAIVQPGLKFSVESMKGQSTSLKQCQPANAGAPATATGCYNFRLRFAENFGTAFRVQCTHNTVAAPACDPQNVPGSVYNTESMFYAPNLPSALTGAASGRGNLQLAGLATQATRLWARFTGIPANVGIYASKAEINHAAGYGNTQGAAYVPTSSGGVSDANPTSAGTTWGSCTDALNGTATGSTVGLVQLSSYFGLAVSSTGTAAVGYEITMADTAQIGYLDTGIMLVTSSNPLPSLGTASVAGAYAPISTLNSMGTASGNNTVPRFADVPQSATAFSVTTCASDLLFTFLTNQAGFDSGIAIANTSRDPFGTVGQSGGCTLNYYGTFASDPTKTFFQQKTTSDVGAGQTAVATLSGGGTNGIAAVPGFQGYMIAQCAFQYAHGYAFISDFGATKLAEGYLALIMDDPLSPSRTGNATESLNN